MAFLILVIGDLHIPDRAPDIPAKFKKLLTPGKISQTLCLGNLTDRTAYEYLRHISPDLKLVRGRCDVEATSLPLTQVVTHASLRIGFLEGFTLVSSEPDLLLAEANRLDVDVLCWGGGIHRFDAFEYMDKFFVNPGSATGAFTTGWTGDLLDHMAKKKKNETRNKEKGDKGGREVQEGEEEEEEEEDQDQDHGIVPSFCLMDVQGISLTLYVYQLRKDANGVENVAVEKVTYTKRVEASTGS